MPSLTHPIDTQLNVSHTDVAQHAVCGRQQVQGTRATDEALRCIHIHICPLRSWNHPLNLCRTLAPTWIVLLLKYAAWSDVCWFFHHGQLCCPLTQLNPHLEWNFPHRQGDCHGFPSVHEQFCLMPSNQSQHWSASMSLRTVERRS